MFEIINYDNLKITISNIADWVDFNVLNKTTSVTYLARITKKKINIDLSVDEIYQLLVGTFQKTNEKVTVDFEYVKRHSSVFKCDKDYLDMNFHLLQEDNSNIDFKIEFEQIYEEDMCETMFLHNLYEINENLDVENPEETIESLKKELQTLKIKYNDLFRIAEYVSVEETGMEIIKRKNGDYSFSSA